MASEEIFLNCFRTLLSMYYCGQASRRGAAGYDNDGVVSVEYIYTFVFIMG